MVKFVYRLVMIVQLIIHYIGILAIIGGFIACAFQNFDRGIELIVSGVGLFILKFTIGIIYIAALKFMKIEDPRNIDKI